MLANQVSRYHVAAAAIRGGALYNSRVAVDAHTKIAYMLHLAQKDKEYIYKHGAGAFSTGLKCSECSYTSVCRPS
jgi:xylulose-5-phosphate/fructose-6-phosphate phosphoketolase